MKRRLVWKPAAEKAVTRLDRSDAVRIIHALEEFVQSGRGDVKALQGAFKGRFRLRVGKWRVFFRYCDSATIEVIDIDNRGQAY